MGLITWLSVFYLALLWTPFRLVVGKIAGVVLTFLSFALKIPGLVCLFLSEMVEQAASILYNGE